MTGQISRDDLADAADIFGVSLGDGDAVHVSRLLANLAATDDGRFAAWKKVKDAEAEGVDPFLYEAFRDVVPSCITERSAGSLGGGSWHGDLIFYSGVNISDEPNRSAGHWNPPTQVEAFQVIQGTVTMLIAVGDPVSPAISSVTANRGDMIVMPAGCWHVTYAPKGPAVVFNVYTAPIRVDSNVDDGEKYKFRSPVAMWLLQDGRGRLTWSGDFADSVKDAPELLLSQASNSGVWLDAVLRHRDYSQLNDLVIRTQRLQTSHDSPAS